MTEQTPDAPESRYADVRSWALDRNEALTRWARTGWIVAGIAITIAVLEAFALASIAPLKTVVPYTLLVDRTTGYTPDARRAAPANDQAAGGADAVVAGAVRRCA
jgi:type IV secretion system protein VirB8